MSWANLAVDPDQSTLGFGPGCDIAGAGHLRETEVPITGLLSTIATVWGTPIRLGHKLLSVTEQSESEAAGMASGGGTAAFGGDSGDSGDSGD
jgi:hypothetical protein